MLFDEMPINKKLIPHGMVQILLVLFAQDHCLYGMKKRLNLLVTLVRKKGVEEKLPTFTISFGSASLLFSPP